MINMEPEEEGERLKSLRMNVPLQIFVDTSEAAGKSRGRVSPGLRGSLARSESAEARQRKRTREWLEGKLGTRSSGRVRSASAGRDKRTDMACRYWAVLFENLRRAVDDLYRTCEGDESCIAAREVVMELENHKKEFNDLINWLKLKTEYENTPGPQRPTSLAWDIRKTSPLGKVTPCSTPGKLTPTRHLLLASPAKRQLNFGETEKKEQGSRSRTVSETIKEVGPGLETDYSPHTSTISLAEKAPVEEDSKCVEENRESEHEKSDSEQEKDITPVNETSEATENVNDIIDHVVETALCDGGEAENPNSESDKIKPDSDVERHVKKAEVKVLNSKNKRSRVRAGAEKGRGAALLEKNKTVSTSPTLTSTSADKNKTGSSSNNDKGKVSVVTSSCLATAPRIEISTEKSKPSPKVTVAASLPAVSKASTKPGPAGSSTTMKSNTAGPTSSSTAIKPTPTSITKTGNTTAAKPGGTSSAPSCTKNSSAPTLVSANKVSISSASRVTTATISTAVKQTTFASTLKTSLSRPQTASGSSTGQTQVPFKTTVLSSGIGTTPMGRPHARLTRSVTAITPSSKPRGKSQRTAAGLLMTSSNLKGRPASSGGQSSRPTKVVAVHQNQTVGSPKQQRISLVARQAKFASQNQNPQRRSLNTQQSSTGGVGGKTPLTGAAVKEGDGAVAGGGLHGSATSLASSGSSGRSWAQVTSGPQAALSTLHCSAEDLGAGRKGRRSQEDSDGWCTVRRARGVRGSPGQGGSFKASTRYKVPSSAISMPSLALEDARGEDEDGTAQKSSSKPHLEKSSSSACMSAREQLGPLMLDELGEEKTGISQESLDDATDAGSIKKKKDQLNQSKQKAMKCLSGDADDMDKMRLERATSFPLSHGDIMKDREADPMTDSGEGGTTIVVEVSVEPKSATDVEFEEREKAIAIAELEVSNLQQKIKETEQAELTDTEGDGTDTDNYTTDTDTNDDKCSEAGTISDIASRYEALLEGLSWAEQLDLEEQLGDPSTLEARLPGRAIQLHEKLSSPARKKEPHETFLHYQEKQARARARRLRFTEEKATKLAVLNTRIEEAMEQRDKLVDERKDIIDTKLKRAEENRIQHIENIRKKAHEEEEKLKEIAFINSLQAQNARMDMITQVETADEKCEERLAEIAGERAKKAEQRRKGAEEAEERRRAMEESRQRQIEEMISRRREKEERIQEVQAVQREQRKVSAAIKDKERLERLSTVRAAEKGMKEELQEKIQIKQEEAAKRHAEYLEQIQQKAWELSLQKCTSDQGVPVIKPYTVAKKCEVCSVLIKSEVHLLSHLRGKQHETAIGGRDLSEAERNSINLKNIVDAPEGEADPRLVAAKERVKAAKRRAKKVKARMASKAAEWESKAPTPNKHLDSPNRARIGKSLKEIEKLLGSQGKGAWPNNSVSSLERAFGEIVRSLDKNSSKDQDVFYALGGFQTIWKIYEMLAECKGESTCVIPLKSLVSAGRVVIKAVHNHDANTSFLLLSNKLALITDILLARLARLEEPAEETMIANLGPDTDPLSASLMTLLSSTIQQVADRESVLDQLVTSRLQDLVSFIVCSGTVDSLASYFQLVRDPIDSSPEVAEFLLTSLQLLTSLTAAVESGGQEQEPSHLFAALQGTELAGTVSMLYGMLLHQGRDSDRCGSPVSLPEHTLAVVTATCTLLHRLVRHGTRVEMIQGVLGQEGISLEFRHIASYLLYYCHHHSQASLLNQVIELVGYFTANHPENQSIVQSGSQPSVLQQLANLPFQFFSQAELKAVLFPSLLASCSGNAENTDILSQEMSWQLIEDFIKSEEGQSNKLVALVLNA